MSGEVKANEILLAEKLARVRRQMLDDLGREPTPEELALECDVTPERILDLLEGIPDLDDLLIRQRPPREKPTACPRCGQGSIRTVVMGFPGFDTLDDPDLRIGGCSVSHDDPDFTCASCGHSWRTDGMAVPAYWHREPTSGPAIGQDEPEDSKSNLTAEITSKVGRDLAKYLGNLRMEHRPSYDAVLEAAADGDFQQVGEMLSTYENLRNAGSAASHLANGALLTLKRPSPQILELERRLVEQFGIDFLGARAWLNVTDDGRRIGAARFDTLARDFVRGWFQNEFPGGFRPDDEQLAAVAHAGSHTLVAARAGSGKTSTMVARAIFLMSACTVPADKILMLAFNKEAARTLRERIEKHTPGKPQPHVMTFHALAFRLVHPGEDLLRDESDSRRPLSQYVKTVIGSFTRSPATRRRVRDAMLSYFEKDWARIESRRFDLSPTDQVVFRRSLQHESIKGDFVKSYGEKRIANILFENGMCGGARRPGTGYYGYEHDVRWQGRNYKPDFSVYDGSKNLRVVIEYFGLAGHPEYDEQMDKKREYWRGRPEVRFLEYFPADVSQADFEDRLLTDLAAAGMPQRRLSDDEIWELIEDRAIDRFTEAMTMFIGRARQRRLSGAALRSEWESIGDDSEHVRSFVELGGDVLDAYLTSMGGDGKDDFSGLIWRAVDHIKAGKSQFGSKGAVDGDLRSIRHLVIDEFQDFSVMFSQVLRQVLSLAPQAEVMAVGDDWQAINEFAGSSTEYFFRFAESFPDATELQLTSNRRSQSELVQVGNAVMAGHGTEARAVNPSGAVIREFDIDSFEPSLLEARRFGKYERFVPSLLRLVREHLDAGRTVAVLARKRRGQYSVTVSEEDLTLDGIGELGAWVNEFLGVEDPSLLRFGSVHGFKGDEADAVILLDVSARTFPLLHPTWPLFQVFGDNLSSIIEAERRLFYVGVSRAKQHLDVLSDSRQPSPFWADAKSSGVVAASSWGDLRQFIDASSEDQVEIRVFNRGIQAFDESRVQLNRNDFSWDGARWSKLFDRSNFDREELLSQPWARHAGIRIETWQGGELVSSDVVKAAGNSSNWD